MFEFFASNDKFCLKFHIIKKKISSEQFSKEAEEKMTFPLSTVIYRVSFAY